MNPPIKEGFKHRVSVRPSLHIQKFILGNEVFHESSLTRWSFAPVFGSVIARRIGQGIETGKDPQRNRRSNGN